MSFRKILSQVKSNNDLVYIALMSIYAGTDESVSKMGARKYILPELVYLLDEKSLSNLVAYFGGESIAIPKASALRDQLYGVMAFYYSEIEGIKDWKEIAGRMDLPYSPDLEAKLEILMRDTEKAMEGIRLLRDFPDPKESLK